MMYTDDFDETLPRTWFGIDNAGSDAVSRYKWMDAVLAHAKNEEIFNCPSQGFPPGGSYRFRNDRNYGSYAWNATYWDGSDGVYPPFDVSLVELAVPADTVLIGDGNGIQHEIQWPNRSADPTLTTSSPKMLAGSGTTALVERHSDRCNVLFCDGHVQSMKLDALARRNENGFLHRLPVQED